MLARRKVELDIMMVSCLTHPDLVRRMAEEGVKGVSRDVDQLMLYRLVNVPRILNLFMVTKDRQRMVEEGVNGVSREVDQLMLYRLVHVPGILNLFMVTKDRQRMAAVTSAVQFWVGE